MKTSKDAILTIGKSEIYFTDIQPCGCCLKTRHKVLYIKNIGICKYCLVELEENFDKWAETQNNNND